ncbi:penicillin-binding [Fusarium beomiforme]|uniref:Penicillin-binding n=1 Tax=Fusarium beomiforme TaxID=44412 RepID=A0A9P5AJD6_9HYPO|nr:penicillin-binding [Fusarium beomiforme]
MIHDVPKFIFDSWVEKLRARDYVLTHVTATGSGNEAIFGGIMEMVENITDWRIDCGIKDYKPFLNDKKGQGMIPFKIQGFRSYGTPDNRIYCILRHENLGNENVVQYSHPNLNFKRIFDAKMTKRFWHPLKLFMSDDLKISPLFTDTSVGNWSSYTHLNATGLEARIKEEKLNGLVPTDIQGALHDGEEHYNVIFQELLSPKPRHWHATGNVTGFKNNEKTEQELDLVMKDFMKTNGVRQAQVAIASKGIIRAERAYTWAEDDRDIVEPSDAFLLASVSKMFLYAAVDQVIKRGQLSLKTKVYERLGYSNATDERAMDITVNHLLGHKGGYDHKKAGEDITLNFGQVALSLPSKGEQAATDRDILEYMLTQPLQSNPGTKKAYSNYGTMLLGYLVSNVTEMPYMDFLEKNVLKGMDVKIYRTSADEHKDDRIIQETRFIGPDPRNPLSHKSVGSAHGGDGAIKEECAAAFSLKASAGTIAQFIGFNSASGIGPRENGWRRGSLEGARTHVESRGKIDFAVVLNTREFSSDKEFERLTEKLIPKVLDRAT